MSFPSSIRKSWVAALMLPAFASVSSASAQSFSDNFNDQSDAQWTEFNPVGVGSYTFPAVSAGNYAYDISAAAQSPTQLLSSGMPSFAASFYEGYSYTQFYESVDILNWEMNPNDTSQPLDEAIGLLARMSGDGSSGYALSLSPHSQQLLLSDIVNGDGVVVDLIDAPLDSTHAYNLQFSGNGSLLSGQLTDLTDPSQQPISFQYTDTSYSAGYGGLLVFDNSEVQEEQSTGAGATFDNYSISDSPEPSSLALLLTGWTACLLRVRRPRR